MFGVGPTLVVEIVQQRRDSPRLFVGASFAGVGADAGFYCQHVFAQRFGLRVFAYQFPGVFAGWQKKFLRVHSNVYWSTGTRKSKGARSVGDREVVFRLASDHWRSGVVV